MAWYPRAVRKQLTLPNRARNRAAMSPRRINLHTAVSNGGSLFNFFNSATANGVFSHFYVTKTGGVEQYQDTAYRASCDLDGNADTVSIESWDGAPASPDDIPAWNAAQLEALGDLVRWLLATHPTIPAKLATDNRASGTSSHGLSYHRLGVPGYMAYARGAGLSYSLSRGKVCPGSRRIAQVPDVLDLATTTTSEDDMPYTRDQLLEITQTAINRVLWEPLIPGRTDEGGSSIRNNVLLMGLRVRQLAARSGVEVDESEIAQEVAAAISGPLKAAVVAAVKQGGEPAVIADAVVERLAASLSA